MLNAHVITNFPGCKDECKETITKKQNVDVK